MKDALEVLYNRRSIRKYKSEQISDTELEQILKAGICAPTAMIKAPSSVLATNSMVR